MKLFILFWCLSAFVHLATSRHNNNNNNRNDNNHNNNNNRNDNNHNNNNDRNDNNHNNNNDRNDNNHNNNNDRNDNNRNNYHSNSPYCQMKCPLFNDPLSGVLHLPGPTKTHFYKCDHGIGIMFVCPSKTHFNPKLQICDWPNRADAVTCQDSPNHIPEGSGDDVWEGITP